MFKIKNFSFIHLCCIIKAIFLWWNEFSSVTAWGKKLLLSLVILLYFLPDGIGVNRLWPGWVLSFSVPWSLQALCLAGWKSICIHVSTHPYSPYGSHQIGQNYSDRNQLSASWSRPLYTNNLNHGTSFVCAMYSWLQLVLLYNMLVYGSIGCETGYKILVIMT